MGVIINYINILIPRPSPTPTPHTYPTPLRRVAIHAGAFLLENDNLGHVEYELRDFVSWVNICTEGWLNSLTTGSAPRPPK